MLNIGSVYKPKTYLFYNDGNQFDKEQSNIQFQSPHNFLVLKTSELHIGTWHSKGYKYLVLLNGRLATLFLLDYQESYAEKII
jgi:hypothetical protein